MKKEMSVLALVLAAVFLFIYLFNLNLTGFAVFQSNSQAAFDAGNYSNVVYDSNASAIALAVNQTYGTYTSEIFDAGNDSSWNNLTWTGEGNVSFVARVCSSADCANATFVNVDLNAMNLTGRYFQYQAALYNNDSNSTVSLSSVSIDYSPVEASASAENLTLIINSPTNTTHDNATQLVNISSNNGTVIYNWNGTNVTYVESSFVTFDEGANTLIAWAIEGNNTVSDSVAFTVDTSFILGCTDSGASNYDASATKDDGSCVFDESNTSSATDATATDTTAVTPTVTNPPVVTHTTLLTASDIAPVSAEPGDIKSLTFNVKNAGTNPITACALKPTGDYASWISGALNSKNLNSGSQAGFPLTVSIPANTADGSYVATVSVDCAETAVSKDFTINVESKKLNATVISAQRTKSNQVRVSYSLEDLSGKDQNVTVSFEILDANNTEVGNASDVQIVAANATEELKLNVPINASAEGNMSLSGKFNSEVYSGTVLEPITGAPISGFAALGDLGTGSYAVVGGVLVILLVLFFSVRKMRRSARKRKSAPKKTEKVSSVGEDNADN